jgi:hypothetical protein
VPQEGRGTRCTDEETIMSTEENKAIVSRWLTEFWGKEFNPAGTGKTMRFTGTTVLKVKNGLIAGA